MSSGDMKGGRGAEGGGVRGGKVTLSPMVEEEREPEMSVSRAPAWGHTWKRLGGTCFLAK